MAKRIRLINFRLKQGAKFVFSPAMEIIVRELLTELSTPPVLVYPNWYTVTDNSCLFLLYCDASVDGLGATSNKSNMKTPFAPLCSSAALPSSLNVTGPCSIWKRAGSSGASSAFAVNCGVPSSDWFGPHGA